MAWAQIAGAIIGTAAGAAAGAYQTKKQVLMKQNAQLQALLNQKMITDEYTGDAANRRQTSKALSEAHNIAEMNNVPQNDTTKGNYLSQFNTVSPSYGYNQGYNQGLANQQAIDDANRSNKEQLANSMLKQAGVDYNVAAARNQATMSGIGNVAKAAGTIGNPFKANKQQNGNIMANKSAISMQDPRFANQELTTSDENAKESPINNESGLPKADAMDAVAQIESVEYKYKDPSIPGCDDERHVGTTAQSLEKEDLFADCVSEGEDGYLRVDRNKLLSKLPLVMDSIEEHLSRLENNNGTRN